MGLAEKNIVVLTYTHMHGISKKNLERSVQAMKTWSYVTGFKTAILVNLTYYNHLKGKIRRVGYHGICQSRSQIWLLLNHTKSKRPQHSVERGMIPFKETFDN